MSGGEAALEFVDVENAGKFGVPFERRESVGFVSYIESKVHTVCQETFKETFTVILCKHFCTSLESLDIFDAFVCD
jgi:hypothetical protein